MRDLNVKKCDLCQENVFVPGYPDCIICKECRYKILDLIKQDKNIILKRTGSKYEILEDVIDCSKCELC